MYGDQTVNALLKIENELPALAGERWPQIKPELDRLLLEFQQAADEDERDRIGVLISDFLEREAPAALKRLDEVIGETADVGGEKGSVGWDVAASDRLRQELAKLLGIRPRPQSVTRYLDVSCPSRVWRQARRFSVVVRLTLNPSDASASQQSFPLQADLPVQVLIEAPKFEILNNTCQEMTVYSDRDSGPLVFDLRPLDVGSATITLDFFQSGNPVGTSILYVEVMADEVAQGAIEHAARALEMLPEVAAPDIILRVGWQPRVPWLRFCLMGPEGRVWREFQDMPLEAELKDAAAQLYRRVTSLTQAVDPTAQAVLHKPRPIPLDDIDGEIKQLGQNLWRDFVPPDLRELYAKERSQWRGRSVLILSDEPYLPWELLWPTEPAWHDDYPWCITLRMTRWLHKNPAGGHEQPPLEFACQRMAVLAPHYRDLQRLPAAQQELSALRQMIHAHGLTDVSPATATRKAVKGFLNQGGYDWFHVAGHGNFYPESPGSDSAIWLEDDVPLAPDAIIGDVEEHIREARPGFFLNACQGGRQGWDINGLAGWANRLVSSGAAVFVAPLWNVIDDSARRFCDAFYSSLLDGQTIGEAVYRARLAAKTAGDPTWFAYSVYAHPNARLSPGEQA